MQPWYLISPDSLCWTRVGAIPVTCLSCRLALGERTVLQARSQSECCQSWGLSPECLLNG
jgi:hypothetical protein